MRRMNPLSLQQVNIDDVFWSSRQTLIRDTVVPYQWAALNDALPGAEPSHTIENLRIAAGDSQGEYYGMVFQDSDAAKWLETVGYVLATRRDEELERIADDLIALLERAQQADGYLNSYFTVAKPGERWTNLRDWHELYCAGHWMEAAVAYYEATGKRQVLDVLSRFGDHIDAVLGPEPGKMRGYPGHPEVELALVKLYRATGNEKYLKLARFFVDERGQTPNFFASESETRGEQRRHPYNYEYSQSHAVVREQKEAVGHSVRAAYLYAGMADVAAESNDPRLLAACRTLWEDITKRKMYVTGGIGSSAYEESFTVPFDLPNDRAYTETCAAIALIFFAHRMLQIEVDSRYVDELERALYNGVLSGMSLDGKSYFYVNPLEVWPLEANHREDMRSVKTTRQPWFGCACCPPNLARLIASLGGYIYSTATGGPALYVHLYIGSEAQVALGGTEISVSQKTNYPWNGSSSFAFSLVQPCEFAFALRIPGWVRETQIRVNGAVVLPDNIEKGYAYFHRIWRDGDTVDVEFSMPVEVNYSHPEVRANAGKVALRRGPLIFCLEEVDNGANLSDVVLQTSSKFDVEFVEDLLSGVIVVHAKGTRSASSDAAVSDLYTTSQPERVETTLRAIPYFAWSNRAPGEMRVWLRAE